MKKIFIAAALVLLAASCHNQSYNNQQSSQDQSATSSPTDPTAGWNSYKSPDKYGFMIKYPTDFGFSTDYNQVQALSYMPSCDQNMVACAFLKKENYSGTNFDGAGVSVNIDPTLNTEAKCYNFAVSTNEAQTPVADITINGTAFKSATGGGGAAGHFDKVQVYRNFKNNMCYEIAQHMVETQVANYPAGTVTQIDENAVWQKLQGVVNTFQFTK